ncbi:hypothetical protein BX600DRAFT_441805 [Xylariales sp. PMI_506]|nr:hypothetical protein BX600DRAFT_441805 [Xylariales sp. PMI_506]
MVRLLPSLTAAAVAIASFLLPVVKADPTHVCATIAAPQRALDLNATVIDVGPRPWGVAFFNESLAFVAINFSIGVLDLSKEIPELTTVLPMPAQAPPMGNTDINVNGYGYRELTLSHKKDTLYIATGYGAIIYDVAKLLAGGANAYAGVLSSNGYAGQGAIEISLTPNDTHVFISQEFGSNNSYGLGNIEVYEVSRLANGTIQSSWKGFIALGYATIGQSFSKDWLHLFVTSEMSNDATNLNQTTGTVSVLDVATLMYTPGKSLVGKVTSGCHPTRCQMSPDGNYLWVAQRDANQIYAFDALKLAANETDDAQVATVNTGTSPIGMAAVGNYILTADSNRFDYLNTTTGVTAVNAKAVLSRGLSNFPQIPTGAFARALAISPSGNKLLVSEFDANTVRLVDITLLNLL